MALKMTATITAESEQGLAEALTKMRRLVLRGCIYDNQKEDTLAYDFSVGGTPTSDLDLSQEKVMS